MRTSGAARDRGAVDVSVEMLFGVVALLMSVLAVTEATAYWHARNVFDEAAAEGVRIASAWDGSCARAVATARSIVRRSAGGWARRTTVECLDGRVVTVRISGRTPGLMGGSLGLTARVSESAPKER